MAFNRCSLNWLNGALLTVLNYRHHRYCSHFQWDLYLLFPFLCSFVLDTVDLLPDLFIFQSDFRISLWSSFSFWLSFIYRIIPCSLVCRFRSLRALSILSLADWPKPIGARLSTIIRIFILDIKANSPTNGWFHLLQLAQVFSMSIDIQEIRQREIIINLSYYPSY